MSTTDLTEDSKRVRKNDNKMITELTAEHYMLMHRTREYWINRALIGGSGNLTVEDVRDDINYLFKAVGDMKTDKPYIFFFKSYAAYQLGYNLLKMISQDQKGSKLNPHGKSSFEHPAMDKVWDVVWFGQNGKSIHELLDGNIKRELQEIIWETIARTAGDGVGMGVWDIIRQNLSKNVSEMTWKNIFTKIAMPAGKGIRSKVTQQVWNEAMEQLLGYVGDEVGTKVSRQLESAMEQSLAKNTTQLEFADHFIGSGNWSGWIAFYDFFVQAEIIGRGDEPLPEEWIRFRRLLEKGIWTMNFYDDCALVCLLPQRVRRDPVTRQLHSLSGPAIEWADGTGQYFIRGINFSETFIDNLGTPPELWDKIANHKITWFEIFGLRNIEQRRIAVWVYGPENILRDSKAELIDKSKKGNMLYKVAAQIATRDPKTDKVTFKPDDRRTNTDENHTRIPEMRVAHYQDPSTDRWYHSFVPTTINKADEAMAWKLQIPVNDYLNKLRVEA